ncbi:hypothetical protein [Paenibacillus oleatilyticus]|uniref:hypothetical protein n=1 Tax=Paenibacillus oleatilyticus TaxID=2594886 RepID=UPI001C1F5D07|nr:hypothetical protein [Paenibacillus oleatilyticus]MBU7316055.1 hypothetical protein [Paenibacillus oleatilyticus]
MRMKDVTGVWDKNRTWQGKHKKFIVHISQNNSPNRYYYRANREEGDIRYNSLWDSKEYSSLEDAQEAAIQWIDEKLKALK